MPIHRHVQDQFFGAQVDSEGRIKPIDEDLLIRNLFEKIPKLCSTDATIMATMHYDTYYGIYDHQRNEEARPMGLMGTHPAEQVFFTHPMFEAARNFRKGRILELFGIDFFEYLSAPHPVIEMLTELANEFNAEQVNVAESVEREIERQSGNKS